MKRKIWWLAFLTSFLTVFLYPFETLVVPEWKAPRRTIRASLFMRVFGPVRNILHTGIHSSFGPSAYLIVLTDFEHSTENADYTPGKPLAQTIVVRRIG